MSSSVVVRSFAGGELAPALAMRADLAKYTTGLRTCRNFIIQRHGGISNRPGTRFVEPANDDTSNHRLLKYNSEVSGESVLIEVGDSYMRFFQQGALVEVDAGDVAAWSGATAYHVGDLVSSGGDVYSCILAHTNHVPPNATYWVKFDSGIVQLPTPWSDVSRLKAHQSGRVITLTAPGVKPYELIFVSVVQWILQPVTTVPQVDAPTNTTVAPIAGALNYAYVVTAAAPGTYEESEPGNQAVAAAIAAPTAAAPHVITWDAVQVDSVDAPEYYVYCDPYGNGIFGFIGTAATNSFNNPGLPPDFLLTPPIPRPLFTSDFPTTSATYQQRRFFANTPDRPDGVWSSRVGFPSNFTISSPLQDDDAITFAVAGNNHHPVRHLVGIKHGLVLLTDGGEHTVAAPPGESLTPNGIEAEQETYNGIADMPPPEVIGNSIIYVQARGAIVRDLMFNVAVEGLDGKDLTLFSGHLFDGYTIVDMAFAQTPHSTVWCVRSDGTLLGLTYIPEQDVWGWHRHDTDGRFERVCVIGEPGEDAVYVIVRRTIGGQFKRYIERLAPRTILDWDVDSFFVDSGLSYSGAPVSSVGGLEHLEGKTVTAVGDGVALGTFVVAGGGVALNGAYSNIHIGLPYDCDFETLDLDVAGSSVRDKKKRVSSLSIYVNQSARTFKAGKDVDHLVPYRRVTGIEGNAKSFTGLLEINIATNFSPEGRIYVRHSDPLPFTALGVIPSVEIGG